jgi:uracil-DNA glycosylase
MSSGEVQLHESWRVALAAEFDAPYMRALRTFLLKQKQAHKVVYPSGDKIFHALDSTPLQDVRVVIIGQDPYHGPGQAHGLCFSVPPGVARPPSLVNICKEINADLGSDAQSLGGQGGCLDGWAKQGVLLLNSVLTVEQARAASHRGQGWEQFTDAVVAAVNQQCEGVVFLLWGSYAQKKGGIVDSEKHCVLSAPHPSPLSAHRGFFGSKNFSGANDYLVARGDQAIDWFAVS